MTVEEIAHAYRSADERSVDELLDRLKRDPLAEQTLWELARRPGRVHEWAPWLARSVLPMERAIPIIQHVAWSADEDAGDAAIQELLDLDPDAAEPLRPRLRERLRARGADWDPRFAIWKLAQLGDVASLPRIKEIAAEFPGEHLTAQSARVAAMVLEADEAALVARLRAGGPEEMAFLATGARLLGSATAFDALEEVALTAEAWEDRVACASELPPGRVTIREPEYEWIEVDETPLFARLRGERRLRHEAVLVRPGEVRKGAD